MATATTTPCEIKAPNGDIEHVCEYSIGYYTLPPSYGMSPNYHYGECKPPEQEQVELCKNWITKNCKPRKTINHNHSSYGLKHDVERDVGEYISNGAFIRAAIELGYKYKVKSPNAWFAMTLIKGED
jgi:hypothetical protein